ncbi:MAG: hypothetical protein GXN93_00865 [Candidatus Diapherotrites archaeon]|nr:hypothetical protein [Candidatus Diapherotrites archaeon]
MRKILFPLVLVLIAGFAGATTLAEAGVNPVVQAPQSEQNWTLPYPSAKDCNNIFVFTLISGKARIYDNNRIVLSAERPGKYRAILSSTGGTMTIELIRNVGSPKAEIAASSYITCDKVPILGVTFKYPPVFHAGGYDTLEFNVTNTGTAEGKFHIVLHLPDVVAPMDPLGQYSIAPNSQKTVKILVTTADTFPQQLLQPQIIEYSDRHGKYAVKTKFGIIGSEYWVPLSCIIHNHSTTVINIGTRPIEINGTLLNPGATLTLQQLDANTEQHCVNALKMQELGTRQIQDHRSAFTAIWAILGILGVLMVEKEIKRSKA